MTLIAGASYSLVHVLKSTPLNLSEFTNRLNTILVVPIALGELGLARIIKIQGRRFTGEGGEHLPIDEAWHFFGTLYQ